MIVVVGGSGRLGRELVSLFKSEDKTVVSIARHENAEADHNLIYNVAEKGEIFAAAKEVEALKEPLEAVIFAAGFYHSAPLGSISEEEFDDNMSVHAKVPMLLTSVLIERIKKDGADIVNIASIAAVKGSADAPAYAASKRALRGFSTDLQAVLKKYPSRVISFCPDAFDPKDENQMKTADVAKLIKQILELPKSMEVTEIVVSLKNPT